MSSFLCFVCHSTVNADTNEDIREKYREVIGMNLCQESHLCFICCHFLNKMWLFKSVCLKRTLEYPVLFSEKGAINLQKSDTQVSILCSEDICIQHLNTNIHIYNNSENSQSEIDSQYVQLQDDRYKKIYSNNDELINKDSFLRNNSGSYVKRHFVDSKVKKKDVFYQTGFDFDDFSNNKDASGDYSQSDVVNMDERNYELDKGNYVMDKCNYDMDKHNYMVKHSYEIDSAKNEHIISSNLEGNIDLITLDKCNYEKDNRNYDMYKQSSNIDKHNYDFSNCSYDMKNQNCDKHNYDINESIDKEQIDLKVNENNMHNNEIDKTNSDLNKTVMDDSNYKADNEVMNSNNEITENVDSVNNVVENLNSNGNSNNESPIHDENESLNNEISNDCPDNDIANLSNDMTKVKKRNKRKKDFIKRVLSTEEQEKEIHRNRKEKKYRDAVFKCYNCGLGFLFKESYQTHMMRHEESNGEFRCPICTLRFASSAVLRSHRLNHSERYCCTNCDTTVTRRQRQTHLKACRGERDSDITCHLCGRVFSGLTNFHQHLRRIHQTKSNNRLHTCNVCGKRYSNQAALRTHMITHINKKFPCDQCTSVFSSPYTLTQHKKKHSNVFELHRCETCDISYNSRKSLLAHRRNALAHKDTVYRCVLCPRTFPSAASLTRHSAALHARTRHLACDRCHNKYSTRKSLLRHMLTHNNEAIKQTPLCHICGDTFKSTSILKRHLNNVCAKNKQDNNCQYFNQ